jgi:hypothetical protein
MKFPYLLLIPLLLLPSCAIYRRQFDCPPDQGVPCTSVTDLEQMIVETEKGPDIFLSNPPDPCTSCACKKIWINAYNTPDGCWIPGHYIDLD